MRVGGLETLPPHLRWENKDENEKEGKKKKRKASTVQYVEKEKVLLPCYGLYCTYSRHCRGHYVREERFSLSIDIFAKQCPKTCHVCGLVCAS